MTVSFNTRIRWRLSRLAGSPALALTHLLSIGLLLLLAAGAVVSQAKAQRCSTCGPLDDCRPGRYGAVDGEPGAAAPGAAVPGAAVPGDAVPGDAVPGAAALDDAALDDQALADAMETASSNNLASSLGAASGPLSYAPNMIGDAFGGGGGSSRSTVVRTFTFAGLNLLGAPYPFTSVATAASSIPAGTPVAVTTTSGGGPIVAINDAAGGSDPAFPFGIVLAEVPAGGTLVGGTTTDTGQFYTSTFRVSYKVDVANPGAGGVVGRTKIAENTSPIPQDRIMFNYSFFENVPLSAGGVNVSRFTPGFEKTFLDGRTSFEMKIPMAVTLDSMVVQGGGTDLSHGEFGNLALTFKGLLLVREKCALSAGLTVAVPTADDFNLLTADGSSLVRIENRAVHVAPFVGALWTPNDRFFAQLFLQWDVDANGNPVYTNPTLTGLRRSGTLTDTTYQYVDLGVGYWAHRSRCRRARLQGVALTGELHWNRSLRGSDVVRDGEFVVGDSSSNVEVFDLTLGAHLECRNNTTITLAYSVPLGGGLDQQFDGEFRVMLNRWFGARGRAVRAPFGY